MKQASALFQAQSIAAGRLAMRGRQHLRAAGHVLLHPAWHVASQIPLCFKSGLLQVHIAVHRSACRLCGPAAAAAARQPSCERTGLAAARSRAADVSACSS